MNPTPNKDTEKMLGFAIVTTQGHDISTRKQVHHFGIIAGQSRYVEKTLGTKPTENIVMGFTPISNPIFYRNNVVAKVHERLREAVNETNTTFAVAKKQYEQDIRSHIAALKQERDEADRRYMYHLRAWTDPESVKAEVNVTITERNDTLQERLKQDVAVHNAIQKALPRKERMPLRNWQRELPDLRVVQVDDVHTLLGIKAEPRFTDFITAQRLVDIAQTITLLKYELSTPARRITVQDIPVKATALACVWMENPWFGLEELHLIFQEVLREMRMMLDADVAELIKIMDAEGDDLTSMLMPDNANVDKLSRSFSPPAMNHSIQSTGKAGDPSYHYRRILGGQCENGKYKVLIDWQPTLEPIEMIDDPKARAFWKEEIDKNVSLNFAAASC